MRRQVCGMAAAVALALVVGCGEGKKDEAKPITTPSGLTYYDLKVGTGRTAVRGDRVQVHYTGWLVEGNKKFDSSRDRNEAFGFLIGKGEVIKGWDEGVEGMKVGGKRRLVIPWKLAYGEEGRPPQIPPKADLLFEVELLEITSPPVP